MGHGGAERRRLVQTQCWCPQGRWLQSRSGVRACDLATSALGSLSGLATVLLPLISPPAQTRICRTEGEGVSCAAVLHGKTAPPYPCFTRVP